MAEKQSAIHIRLQPGARKDELCGWMDDDTLKLRVKAKPVEGKANQNLLRFLSKQLNIHLDAIEIKSGGKSRNKLIMVKGLDQGELIERINALMAQEP